MELFGREINLNKIKIFTDETKKKYNDAINSIIQKSSYKIDRIELFAPFESELPSFVYPLHIICGTISPISFSECESHCKILGRDNLVYHKTNYDNAKMRWAKRQCTDKFISEDEYFKMMKEIQTSTIPFGCFSLAFKTKNENGMPVYTPENTDNILEFSCRKFAKMLSGEDDGFYQMNVYTNNVLSEEDIDKVYQSVIDVMFEYNKYCLEVAAQKTSV